MEIEIDKIPYYKREKSVINRMYAQQKLRNLRKFGIELSYTKQQLEVWLYKNGYYNLYVNWVNCGYQRDLAPSVDRLDDYKGYSLDNIRLVTWLDNRNKGAKDVRSGINTKTTKAVVKLDLEGKALEEFHSIRSAERMTGLFSSEISRCCNGKAKTSGGYKWIFKI
jgi:hypothetical protein